MRLCREISLLHTAVPSSGVDATDVSGLCHCSRRPARSSVKGKSNSAGRRFADNEQSGQDVQPNQSLAGVAPSLFPCSYGRSFGSAMSMI